MLASLIAEGSRREAGRRARRAAKDGRAALARDEMPLWGVNAVRKGSNSHAGGSIKAENTRLRHLYSPLEHLGR